MSRLEQCLFALVTCSRSQFLRFYQNGAYIITVLKHTYHTEPVVWKVHDSECVPSLYLTVAATVR
jgi:hypothetical protein